LSSATTQSVDLAHTILIQNDPTAVSVYSGYVCAWREGACCCSALIADLGGKPHMRTSWSYQISTSAPSHVAYTIYAITSETASGPTGSKTTGELWLTGERTEREAKERTDLQPKTIAPRVANASHSEDQVESNSPPKVELQIDSSIPEEAQAIILNEFRRIFSLGGE
jgi:hypothetical protein